jgi:hypothetical protein
MFYFVIIYGGPSCPENAHSLNLCVDNITLRLVAYLRSASAVHVVLLTCWGSGVLRQRIQP